MPYCCIRISASGLHLLAAGAVDRLAGHVAGFGAEQKDHHVGDVVVLAAAAHGHLVDVLFADLLLGGTLIAGVLLVEGIDPQRGIEPLQAGEFRRICRVTEKTQKR